MTNTGAEYKEFQNPGGGASWRKFFVILAAICAVIIGLALSSRAENTAAVTPAVDRGSQDQPVSVQGDGLFAALHMPHTAADDAQIIATVENFVEDPAAYTSDRVYKDIIANAAANGQTLSREQAAEQLTLAEGFTVDLQPATLDLPFAGRDTVATLRLTAEWTGQYAPMPFQIGLIKENGSWKVFSLTALNPVN